jgi:ubiquinone/menaquinone biosynthesis C-methylase UbiE
MDIVEDLLREFRRATILLAVENCDLRETLIAGYTAASIPACTSDRVVLAAAALNMLEGIPLRWTEPYRTIAKDEHRWRRLIALIGHQKTYLQLAMEVNSRGIATVSSPIEQLAVSPSEYLAFLQGVEASHWEHAKWFAQHPDFADSKHLVDLGGGLGTFSKSWIKESELRRATLVDFPQVAPFVSAEVALDDRLQFYGSDLSDLKELPAGDLYLLANVLHLVPDWKIILRTVVRLIAKPSLVCVFEADQYNESGRLFDLQVHLRSGGTGGLISPEDIRLALSSLGLTQLHELTFSDERDPFKRQYYLWVATNA